MDSLAKSSDKKVDAAVSEVIRKTGVLDFVTGAPKKADKKEATYRCNFISGLLKRSITERLGSLEKPFHTHIKPHLFFSGMDWNLIAKKQLAPPYKPSTTESNVGALVVLDDLLSDGDSLNYKPRKLKPKNSTNSESSGFLNTPSKFNLFSDQRKEKEKLRIAKEKECMDDTFLDYVYTMPQMPKMTFEKLQAYKTEQDRQYSSMKASSSSASLDSGIVQVSKQKERAIKPKSSPRIVDISDQIFEMKKSGSSILAKDPVPVKQATSAKEPLSTKEPAKMKLFSRPLLKSYDSVASITPRNVDSAKAASTLSLTETNPTDAPNKEAADSGVKLTAIENCDSII